MSEVFNFNPAQMANLCAAARHRKAAVELLALAGELAGTFIEHRADPEVVDRLDAVAAEIDQHSRDAIEFALEGMVFSTLQAQACHLDAEDEFNELMEQLGLG